jgi:hypothetical protein
MLWFLSIFRQLRRARLGAEDGGVQGVVRRVLISAIVKVSCVPSGLVILQQMRCQQ